MITKTLVLVRHAHRDKSEGRDRDNGLSPKGRRQASAFAKRYRKLHVLAARRDALVVTSPKRRCIETIETIVPPAQGQAIILDCLDEGGRVRAKAMDFLKWWESDATPALTVACSHGDWIPEFLKCAVGRRTALEKGAMIELVIKRELFRAPKYSPRE